jgi:hypothetical protein
MSIVPELVESLVQHATKVLQIAADLADTPITVKVAPEKKR